MFYAVREMGAPGDPTRRSRQAQSLAADALMCDLARAAGVAPASRGRGSKSHCRGLVAAALASSDGGRVGADIEYDAPGRPIGEIAAIFLGGPPEDLTARAFYRAWTGGEAWLKAFGARPDADALRAILEHAARDGEVYRLGEAGVMHESLPGGFVLSLVWSDPEGVYARPVRLLG
jgi:hypothetical protein